MTSCLTSDTLINPFTTHINYYDYLNIYIENHFQSLKEISLYLIVCNDHARFKFKTMLVVEMLIDSNIIQH